MKLRHRGLIRLAGLLAAVFIRCWMGLVRKKFRIHGQAVHPNRMRLRQSYIYAFWHETLLVPATIPEGCQFNALISRHADGELIAEVCRHLGIGTVRGSSTRGGAVALREMIQLPAGGHLAVTPDGPHGPRRKAQVGVVFLAAQTGMPIVPLGVGFSRAWRAGSWDRFAVPLPGSTVTCVAGRVIQVPSGLSRQQLEVYQELVEQELLAATAEAEEWANGVNFEF